MDSGERPYLQPLRPVLLILHQEHSTAGHVGRLLAKRGHPLDIRRPRYGDPLPDTLAGHAGTVIFGGPMSANDGDDYIKREIALIELALKEQAPYLGICLGAQMMAVCLGAKVARDTNGAVEIGYHDLSQLAPKSLAPMMLGGRWPDRVYQWHSEGFDLPVGAVPLATSAGPFPNQAFAYGPAAIGLQFHPEITYGMIARWSGRNEAKLAQPGAQARPAQLAEHIAVGPAISSWTECFLAGWQNSDRRITDVSSADRFL